MLLLVVIAVVSGVNRQGARAQGEEPPPHRGHGLVQLGQQGLVLLVTDGRPYRDGLAGLAVHEEEAVEQAVVDVPLGKRAAHV